MIKEGVMENSTGEFNFQRRFILTFALICLSGMTISAALFNYLAVRELETLRWKMAIHAYTLADVVTPYLLYVSIFTVAFTSAALAAFSRFLRWKLKGPIYRLKNSLEMVGGGNLRLAIRLRKTDPFQAPAMELDKMVTAFRYRFRKIHRDFRLAKRTIDHIEDVREDLLPDRCAELRARLHVLKGAVRGGA